MGAHKRHYSTHRRKLLSLKLSGGIDVSPAKTAQKQRLSAMGRFPNSRAELLEKNSRSNLKPL
jgi:hypothetical protein